MNEQFQTTSLGTLVVLSLVLLSPACSRAASQENEGRQVKQAAEASSLDPKLIEQAAGTEATQTADGTVRISWSRDDVKVTVDGMPFPASAGLGSWAAFKADGRHGAMVMGDTVVFRDEVDAAMDAAFAHGLEITALHNHFFYDQPKVYFMHIGGHGDPGALAKDVRAMWDAIKQVRAQRKQPANGFGGPQAKPGGQIDAPQIAKITGLEPSVTPDRVKVSKGRTGYTHIEPERHERGEAREERGERKEEEEYVEEGQIELGGSMGLSSWAAFVGSDALASIDGDFIMKVGEVQPVMHALRKHGIHIVALHNHMLEEQPLFYFLHFWGVGPAADLAHGFRAALDAQARTGALSEPDGK